MSNTYLGKTFLITGGAAGIGLATVQVFRKQGAKVITCSRRETPPDSIKGDAEIQYFSTDLSTIEGCEQLATHVKKCTDHLDGIIHVAGGSSAPNGGYFALKEEDWIRDFNLNFFSVTRLDRLLIPMMLANTNEKGAIIYVSSIQRELPMTDSTIAYASAKSALTSYCKSVSKELGPKGIRAVSVAPGWTETEASVQFIEGIAKDTNQTVEEAKAMLIKRLGGIPLGRPAKPIEVANLISYMASPLAGAITGCEIRIDSGSVPTI